MGESERWGECEGWGKVKDGERMGGRGKGLREREDETVGQISMGLIEWLRVVLFKSTWKHQPQGVHVI